jgi:hypothetical protein
MRTCTRAIFRSDSASNANSRIQRASKPNIVENFTSNSVESDRDRFPVPCSLEDCNITSFMGLRVGDLEWLPLLSAARQS